MASIFITGSADGLGQMAARTLVQQGHQVVLHARNENRAQEALTHVPGAAAVLSGDLSSMEQTRKLAQEVNAIGYFDSIIHNAGLYQVPDRSRSVDGLPLLLAVNTLAPYILTALIQKPKRLIYLSSGMHLQGDATLKGLQEKNLQITYADSKLHDLILAKAVARKWTHVYSNAVDPGWVPTKMGGAGAPSDLVKGYQTQVWLATSNEDEAKVSGHYFHHLHQAGYLTAADDIQVQEQFLTLCERITGVSFPAN